MNAVQAATAAAAKATRMVRGETVVYSRGAVSIICTAIRGTTSWDRTAPYAGVRVGDRSTDWIIEVAALVSGSTQYTPQRGDEIEVDGVVFRVMPYGPDNQLWQYHDRERTIFRIHTKERV